MNFYLGVMDLHIRHLTDDESIISNYVNLFNLMLPLSSIIVAGFGAWFDTMSKRKSFVLSFGIVTGFGILYSITFLVQKVHIQIVKGTAKSLPHIVIADA